MTEISELEKKAMNAWLESVEQKKLADEHRSIDSYKHTIDAIYSQNIALGYENDIIIKNQEEILKYLKKEETENTQIK